MVVVAVVTLMEVNTMTVVAVAVLAATEQMFLVKLREEVDLLKARIQSVLVITLL